MLILGMAMVQVSLHGPTTLPDDIRRAHRASRCALLVNKKLYVTQQAVRRNARRPFAFRTTLSSRRAIPVRASAGASGASAGPLRCRFTVFPPPPSTSTPRGES